MVLNKKGKILDGKYKDWGIAVQDNTAETGGYYVLIWSDKDSTGYDDWFENYNEMEVFVTQEYIVEWTDQDYLPKQNSEEEQKNAEEFQALAKKNGF